MKAAETARLFAIAAHGSQRYGTRPYAFRLNHVVGFLEAFGEDTQVIGYLHKIFRAVYRENLCGTLWQYLDAAINETSA